MEEKKLTNLSELELQNLRHLIGGYDTTHCKMQEYANSSTDPQLKQFFEKSAQSAMKNKEQLMTFFNQEAAMNMDEKTMVNDTLVGINSELVRYGEMIPQTDNQALKQTLKQFRNACETSQEELYQMAREKSYYVPAAQATSEEVQHVKSLFTSQAM